MLAKVYWVVVNALWSRDRTIVVHSVRRLCAWGSEECEDIYSKVEDVDVGKTARMVRGSVGAM